MMRFIAVCINPLMLVYCTDLAEMPIVLLGVLSQNEEPGYHGELVLKDSTAAIVCEVRVTSCPRPCVSRELKTNL